MKQQPNVDLSELRSEPEAWPRFGLDPTRVAEFMSLYAADGPTALPPIEVVPDGEGGLLIAEGRHRIAAAVELGWQQLPAVTLDLPPGSDPVNVAYVRGLETAATASKPLTRSERRAAV